MRWTQSAIQTQNTVPGDVNVTSLALLLQGGFLDLYASGFFHYLPLGQRMLQNLITTFKAKLALLNGQEFILSPLIWDMNGLHDTGMPRFTVSDQHDRYFSLPDSHLVEFIKLATKRLRSYRDLPQVWYQIQPHFIDWAKPKSGLVQSRAYWLGEVYLFSPNESTRRELADHLKMFHLQWFQQCGIPVIQTKTGDFLLSPTGEQRVVGCANCGYYADQQIAPTVAKSYPSGDMETTAKNVHTPNKRTIGEVSAFLGIPAHRFIKTLLFMVDETPHLVLIRGDHDASEPKLREHFGDAHLRTATATEIEQILKTPVGFLGPQGRTGIPITADIALKGAVGMVTGANIDQYHTIGLTVGQDFPVDRWADVRLAQEGDGCPQCSQPVASYRAIQLVHRREIIRTSATFQDANGVDQPLQVSMSHLFLERLIAALIEVNHDDDGICFPPLAAPFAVIILPLNMADDATRNVAEDLYRQCQQRGISVLMDDRDAHPGVKFKDADRIGCPYRLVIGRRGLKNNTVEIQIRRTQAKMSIPYDQVMDQLTQLLSTDSSA
ncbi:MAG: hypothetical protein D6675_08405 [Gemmatimonadetes bacterium]|nr:MAG: hypothetical protein D6675_08405 [Gemmatimonadota bacterium]